MLDSWRGRAKSYTLHEVRPLEQSALDLGSLTYELYLKRPSEYHRASCSGSEAIRELGALANGTTIRHAVYAS